MAAAVAALAGALPGCATPDCGRYEDAERASHRTLRWRDFKGPRGDPKLRGAVAYVATAIVVEPLAFALSEAADGTWSAWPSGVCARAFVLKRRSGFLRGEVRRADLAHEQGHFDLTEIYARTLAQRVARVQENAASREQAVAAARRSVDRVLQRTLGAWRAAQRAYDLETERSAMAQRRWLRWIVRRLDVAPGAIHLRLTLPARESLLAGDGKSLTSGDLP